MESLVKEIRKLQKSIVSKKIRERLREFESFKNKGSEKWFSELCFCILAANSKGRNAYKIQQELGIKGLLNKGLEEIRQCIIKNKHRFHNNKAKFIVEARKHAMLKEAIKKIIKEKGEFGAREWLVENVKGIGYKEASHFLRNTGSKSLAILDRHVLSLMTENTMIKERPKTLTRKKYIEIEEKLEKLAEKLKMSQAELDMYLWYMKTGEVLK